MFFKKKNKKKLSLSLKFVCSAFFNLKTLLGKKSDRLSLNSLSVS